MTTRPMQIKMLIKKQATLEVTSLGKASLRTGGSKEEFDLFKLI